MFCLANKERSHYYVWANKERRQNRNLRLKRVGENFEQAWDQMSGGEHAVDRGRVKVAACGTVCTCTCANEEPVFVVALRNGFPKKKSTCSFGFCPNYLDLLYYFFSGNRP